MNYKRFPLLKLPWVAGLLVPTTAVMALQYSRYRSQAQENVSQQLAEGETLPPGEPPGRGKTIKTTVLEESANVLQRFDPVKAIHFHLCGFHFYSGESKERQLMVHHYCNHLNEDLSQCVLYDSDKRDAKLIGIEYVISEKLFKSLPPEEQMLWHSHDYEVTSGTLTAPRVPAVAETALMRNLANTYGKTWHTWQVDRDPLPLGVPRLMMGLKEPYKANPRLVEQRDAMYGEPIEQIVERRKSIQPHTPHPNSNIWMRGISPIVKLIFKSEEK